MNKQLKEMLKGAKIQVKSRNCKSIGGFWENEDIKNLLDFVNKYKIKITKIKKENVFIDYQHLTFYKIKMYVGSLKIEDKAAYSDLENVLYKFINYKSVFFGGIGGKIRIKTRFGINNINN